MARKNQVEAPKAVDPKTLTRRQREKLKNHELNETQHQTNLRFMQNQLISPEETVKEIHTYTKKGKKVIENTRTVVKQKRPSKLIRKHIRARIRDEEGRIIKRLEQKFDDLRAAKDA